MIYVVVLLGVILWAAAGGREERDSRVPIAVALYFLLMAIHRFDGSPDPFARFMQ